MGRHGEGSGQLKMLGHNQHTDAVLSDTGFLSEQVEVGSLGSPIANFAGSRRREQQLLLACSRTTVTDDVRTCIHHLIEAGIDWYYLLEKAYDHRVTPLVYQSLNSAAPQLVPKPILRELQRRTDENARYNLYRTRELIRLVQLLRTRNISCLPFKGPILSALVYHNLALREYSDLDLLIHPKDVLKTRDVLLSEGYRIWSQPNRNPKAPVISARNKDVIFESANKLVRVELHWRLTGRHFSFPLDMQQLWQRLEITSLAGVKLRTLELEDLALYLCMHGSRHGWERLLWICDVAEIIRLDKQIDWQRVSLTARQLGCERMLALGLLLARNLLDAKLPEEDWKKIHVDQTIQVLAVQVAETLFSDTQLAPGISYWNDLHLRVRERLRDRMRLRVYYYRRYLRLALVPNERDHNIVHLPPFLFSLYYLLRPFRLAKTFGLVKLRGLWKAL
jgi:Uncharacterised nucleotidyltransferase